MVWIKKYFYRGDLTYTTLTYNETSFSDLNEYFKDCTSIETIKGMKINNGANTTIESMFEGYAHLTNVGVTLNNIGSVINAKNMFKGCTSPTSAPNLRGQSNLVNG